MKTLRTRAIRLALVAVLAASPLVVRAAGPHPPLIPGELLVRPASDADAGTLESIRAGVEARFERRLLDGSVEVWQVRPGLERNLARVLTDLPAIRWAEPNFTAEAFATTPNDPGFGNQWGHARVGSTTAWDIATGSNQITIAIIDTGVDPNHPDLAAKLVAGHDFVDDDANPRDLHDPNGVYSTTPTYACTLTDDGDSFNYDRLQGTSQATPFVAGVAAILRGMLPAASPDTIQQILQRTAADRGPAGWDPDYGWGLLQADDAVESVIFGDGFESGTISAWTGGS